MKSKYERYTQETIIGIAEDLSDPNIRSASEAARNRGLDVSGYVKHVKQFRVLRETAESGTNAPGSTPARSGTGPAPSASTCRCTGRLRAAPAARATATIRAPSSPRPPTARGSGVQAFRIRKGRPSGLGEPLRIHLGRPEEHEDQGDDLRVDGSQNAAFAEIQGVEIRLNSGKTPIECGFKARMCTLGFFNLNNRFWQRTKMDNDYSDYIRSFFLGIPLFSASFDIFLMIIRPFVLDSRALSAFLAAPGPMS